MSQKSEWIGVDLDGTLAHYAGWRGVDYIGHPIPEMLTRVKGWLAEGRTVKIFTARMHGHGAPVLFGGTEDVVTPIKKWCVEHIGQELEVTNVKDYGMIELWDDRCVQVRPNMGTPVDPLATQRTNHEIIDQTNALARRFYQMAGYRVPEGTAFQDATHPHEKLMWRQACEAQILLTQTDPDEVLAEMGDGE